MVFFASAVASAPTDRDTEAQPRLRRRPEPRPKRREKRGLTVVSAPRPKARGRLTGASICFMPFFPVRPPGRACLWAPTLQVPRRRPRRASPTGRYMRPNRLRVCNPFMPLRRLKALSHRQSLRSHAPATQRGAFLGNAGVFGLAGMAMQSVGWPGANLMRAPLIRRTGGFAKGSSSSMRGSRLRAGKDVSAMVVVSTLKFGHPIISGTARAARDRRVQGGLSPSTTDASTGR